MEITPIPEKKRQICFHGLWGEVDVEMLESMVVSTSSCFFLGFRELIFWKKTS